MFLDCVIYQMDELIVKLTWSQSVFLGSCSNVAVFVEISFDLAIYACDQGEASDVELPILVQQRIRYVLLKNYGPPMMAALMNLILDISISCFHNYSTASVWVLSRLYYPNILGLLIMRELIFSCFIMFLELHEFKIICTCFDVKREWQRFKNTLIIATLLIIVAHIEEQGLLIIQMMIEFQFIVEPLKSPLQWIYLMSYWIQCFINRRFIAET